MKKILSAIALSMNSAGVALGITGGIVAGRNGDIAMMLLFSFLILLNGWLAYGNFKFLTEEIHGTRVH